MPQTTNSLKKLSLLGLAVLGVLFIGGIVFYKERVFFCDASYIAFNILKYDRLFIQEHRFGSFVTQMVPLLGAKLHLPVGIILKSYAFSFNLFYLLVGIVVYRCRQYGLLLVMALTYTLLVSDTYFWTNNEIHQALAWMFLFFAVVLRMGEKNVSMILFLPVFLLLAVTTLYTHFIVIIPMAFLWGYFWIAGDSWYWNRNTSILLTACLLAIVASKFVLLNGISYEAGHLHNITHFSAGDIVAAAHASVVKKFAMRLLKIYWLAPILFALGIVTLLKNNTKALLAWTLVSFTGYVIIMGLTYTDGDILLFHIESEWESMAVIFATPFVFAALPKMEFRYAVILLVVVLVVRCGYIVNSSFKFSWRTRFKEHVLTQMKKKNITKLALVGNEYLHKKNDFFHRKNIQDWALPEESLLMSTMNGDQPTLTFFLIDPEDKITLNLITQPKEIYTSFDSRKGERLNNNYFRFDTSHPYRVMTYEELNVTEEDINFPDKEIK